MIATPQLTLLLCAIIHAAAACVGLVAGATDIPALGAVRAAAPHMWILCPGVGAQGGDAQVSCVTLFFFPSSFTQFYLILLHFKRGENDIRDR